MNSPLFQTQTKCNSKFKSEHKCFVLFEKQKPIPLNTRKHRFKPDSSQGELPSRILDSVSMAMMVMHLGSVMD